MSGIQAYTCYDNSLLYINNTNFSNGNMGMLYNIAQVNITNSIIYAIVLLQKSKAMIIDTNLWIISGAVSSLTGYALNLSNSTTEALLTFSWNYSDLIFLMVAI